MMPTTQRELDVLFRVRGIVQGVGFRPFVQRAAARLRLRGWVRNDSQGVLVRVSGAEDAVGAFARALRADAPPAARVQAVEAHTPDAAAPPVGDDFAIFASERSPLAVETAAPPDLALCAECRRELLAPSDRRHRYPFINCTQCGPRYTILERLPYDRARTTMSAFRMCPACQCEYHDPAHRRFHAQPNACSACGPQVVLLDRAGREIARRDVAIRAAVALLSEGRIVAVKGVGGYHLFVDATNEAAVAELRRRKHREEKPLAVMFRDLDTVRAFADVPASAAALLTSPAAPIVLVPRRAGAGLAASVAPGNPWLGVLLAYAPLHVLLLQAATFPMIATSANLSEEPLCTENEEAHARLAAIADAFLDHDRPIAHPVDDSLVRPSSVGPIMLRRARGYAPAPLPLPSVLAGHLLCVGAQMKSAVAIASGNRLVLSPHVGDLGAARTLKVFRRTIATLGELYRSDFTAIACDKHPDYASSRYAAQAGVPVIAVQHHLAHVLACLLEHGRDADRVLGVAWDGTGCGEDGTIWGGEFFLLENKIARRFARLRPFRLAGGETAVRNARRVALALLHEVGAEQFASLACEFGFSENQAAVLRTMLARGVNSPVTSSIGRLFDAVGALLNLGRHNCFEGQVPLAVESAATLARDADFVLPLPVRDVRPGSGAVCELDWQPLLERLLYVRTHDAGGAAAAFHRALAGAVVAVARRAGAGTVALSGGCFQNALLLELTVAALHAAGFTVLTHRELPPNDGNIAAGQALGTLWGLTSVVLP